MMVLLRDLLRMPMLKFPSLLVLVLALSACAHRAPIPTAAPHTATNPSQLAPVRATMDRYANVSLRDDYRYMEDLKHPDTAQWVASQNARTRESLDGIPGRKQLAERIEALHAVTGDQVYWLTSTNKGRLFFLKQKINEPTAKLYRREGLRGPDILVFDPETVRPTNAEAATINVVSASPDGRHASVVVTSDETELGTLWIIDVETGTPVGEAVPHIWGEQAAQWSSDGQYFFYNRAAVSLDEVPDKLFKAQRLTRRTVGAGRETDVPVAGSDVPAGPPASVTDWVFYGETAASEFALVSLYGGVGGTARIYSARRADVLAGRAAWRAITQESDEVRGFDLIDQWLYVRTSKGAGRFQLLRYDLVRPDSPPQSVIPEQADVLTGMVFAKDGIYIVLSNGATERLMWTTHPQADGSVPPLVQIEVPGAGAISLEDGNIWNDGVMLTISAWTSGPRVLHVRRAGDVIDTELVLPLKESFDQFSSRDAACIAEDGARVPISIVAHKDTLTTGKNPTLLIGYGGYGDTLRPRFAQAWMAFLEQGGVLAYANPRGSGAYGESWYRAGVGATKANTWRDMNACAKLLIDEGLTAPEYLAIRGSSMGGVAAGRAITDAPERYAAAVIDVGITDAIRFIAATANGPNHEKEMGDVKTAEGVQQLLKMSMQHHIRDGVRYPAVLFTHGSQDNRVAPWLSVKAAARLIAATASQRPIFLRLDEEAGHGSSPSGAVSIDEMADVMAFVLWQTGHAGFQATQ
jgi:prolyl oligopeptidase